MFGLPGIGFLDRFQPALIIEHAAKFGKPGTQPIGHPFGDPERDLSWTLHRVLPAVTFFEPHAKDATDWFIAHGGAVFLAVFAIGPNRHRTMPGLAVGKENIGALTDALHIECTERTATTVGNKARIRVDRADRPIPPIPQVKEARLPPEIPIVISRILWVAPLRQIATRRQMKVRPAGGTVADAVPRPAVAEDRIQLIARHHLLVDCGHKVKIVGTQGAGDPAIWVGPMMARFTFAIHRSPFGMRVKGILANRMGIAASHHHHPQRATAPHQLAKGITITQPRAAIMIGNLGWVIGGVATGAETSGISFDPLKIIKPKVEIIVARIIFNQGELRPAHRAVEPSRCGGCGHGERVRFCLPGGVIGVKMGEHDLLKTITEGMALSNRVFTPKTPHAPPAPHPQSTAQLLAPAVHYTQKAHGRVDARFHSHCDCQSWHRGWLR